MSSIRRLKPNYIKPGDPGYIAPLKSFEYDELCFDDTHGQYCTLQTGHDGDHVSHGTDDEMIATWPRDENKPWVSWWDRPQRQEVPA